MARNELAGERIIVSSEVLPEEIFTTDYTLYRTLDTDGAGTTAMEMGIFSGQGRVPYFAMSPLGLGGGSGPNGDGECPAPLPGSVDPPFPPVYPYFFSTNVIYGREHMNNVLRMTRGDTYAFTGTITLDGSALNLTNASITMSAKWNVQDSTNVFQLTESSGITVTDAAAGEISVVIPPSATSSLPSTEVTLVYDIQVVQVDGSTYTVAKGNLVVAPDVTV